jgi:PIN like domain
VPSSEELPEVYVDRSLGQTLVPDALRECGFVVHTEVSVFGHVPEGVPDSVWLERAGREGWVVFTKDKRIRYRIAERAALVGGSVRAFVLAGGNLSGRDQAAHLVGNVDAILRASGEPGPFVYSVQAERIVRLFPA